MMKLSKTVWLAFLRCKSEFKKSRLYLTKMLVLSGVSWLAHSTPVYSQQWSLTTTACPNTNLLTGPILGTTGSYSGNASDDKTKVFDGDINTYFDGPAANGVWAGMDLGAVKQIACVRLRPRNGFVQRMEGGMLQVASDASFTSPTTLYTIPAGSLSGGFIDYYISGPAMSARYVRFLSPNGGYGNIAEMTVYGNGGVVITSSSTVGWSNNYNTNGYKLVGGSGVNDTMGLTVTSNGVVLVDTMGIRYRNDLGNKYGRSFNDTGHYGNTVPDYVFEPDYKLMSLDVLDNYISEHKHLPDFKSEQEYSQQGYIDMKQFNFLLLRKIEELTLHMIEMDKRNEALKKRLNRLERNKNISKQ